MKRLNHKQRLQLIYKINIGTCASLSFVILGLIIYILVAIINPNKLNNNAFEIIVKDLWIITIGTLGGILSISQSVLIMIVAADKTLNEQYRNKLMGLGTLMLIFSVLISYALFKILKLLILKDDINEIYKPIEYVDKKQQEEKQVIKKEEPKQINDNSISLNDTKEIIDRIEQLNQLRISNAITEEEYNNLKQPLIDLLSKKN